MVWRRSPVAPEGIAVGTPPAAARGRDRFRVEADRDSNDARLCGRRRRKAEEFGDGGFGARNNAAISGGRSRPHWRAVRTTLASTCWVSVNGHSIFRNPTQGTETMRPCIHSVICGTIRI